ncbi:MAG: tetratricopeptide repeat protein, partial [Pseudolabrys sp.]
LSQSAPQTIDAAGTLRRALALHQRGQLADAEKLYGEVLAAQPDSFDALHLCGVLRHQRGEHAQALALIARALKSNARSAAAHSNYGNVLSMLNRHDEALASFDRAVALTPDYPEALNSRGNTLVRLGRTEDALADYAKAIALKPRFAEALLGQGNVLYALGHFAEALANYDAVLAIAPNVAEIHNNCGNALWSLKRPLDALARYDAALALKSEYAEAHNNRGNALLDLNRTAEALTSFEQALRLKPDYPDALVNRGTALGELRREDAALASFDRAIALTPRLAEAHWNKALLLLSRGDFEAGLPDYEWRWQRPGAQARNFAQPQWCGEDITGRTILLHAEQGFGDTLQFVRYVPIVASRGARIILEAPDALRPLLSGTEGVASLVGCGAPLPPFDWHCPLLSLPLAFGTTLATIPAAVPYLHAPAGRAVAPRALLPHTGNPRVGIAWSGKPSHNNDHNRSIALTRLAPLLQTPGIGFVSLQRDLRDADRAALADFPGLTQLDEALVDFADTAAVMAQLDLVIAVDTAVAHLAGALGRPLWVLLPHVPDWRWLLDRDDSPWYPSARLFRQPVAGDWDSVIARLSGELTQIAAAP